MYTKHWSVLSSAISFMKHFHTNGFDEIFCTVIHWQQHHILCNKVLYVLSVFSIIWFFFLLYFHFQFIFNRLYLALLGCITCLEVCNWGWHRLSINIVIIGNYLFHMNHMHGWSHGWMHIICKKTVTKNSIPVILHWLNKNITHSFCLSNWLNAE